MYNLDNDFFASLAPGGLENFSQNQPLSAIVPWRLDNGAALDPLCSLFAAVSNPSHMKQQPLVRLDSLEQTAEKLYSSVDHPLIHSSVNATTDGPITPPDPLPDTFDLEAWAQENASLLESLDVPELTAEEISSLDFLSVDVTDASVPVPNSCEEQRTETSTAIDLLAASYIPVAAQDDYTTTHAIQYANDSIGTSTVDCFGRRGALVPHTEYTEITTPAFSPTPVHRTPVSAPSSLNTRSKPSSSRPYDRKPSTSSKAGTWERATRSIRGVEDSRSIARAPLFHGEAAPDRKVLLAAFFKQKPIVFQKHNVREPRSTAGLLCRYVSPMGMLCSNCTWADPGEMIGHAPLKPSRQKGFSSADRATVLRHMAKHREPERLYLSMMKLEADHWTEWDNEAIDEQLFQDELAKSG